MTSSAGLEEISAHLTQAVGRLTSISLNRLPPIAGACHDACQFLVQRTRRLDPGIPDIDLPAVGPSALGWQLDVVGRDYLEAAAAADDPEWELVRDCLVDLRQQLP